LSESLPHRFDQQTGLLEGLYPVGFIGTHRPSWMRAGAVVLI
jgi:hypothetical protein